MRFRGMVAVMLAATTVGCGQYGASGPDDLGLIQHFNPASLPVSLSASIPLSAEGQRNQVLSAWIVRSDYLCNNYQLRLSRAIRDSRLGTDAVATVLSGLATILAPVATKTALSGAATMTLGIGSDIQTDVFSQQASDVVSSAIQTVRTRARKALQQKMQEQPYANYTLEQGLVDVQRYDQETCNLNVGLNELRASLLTGPATERPNDPILRLPPPPPTPIFIPPPPPVVNPRVPSLPPPHNGLISPRRDGGAGTRTSGRDRAFVNPRLGVNDQIEGAIGEEKNIPVEMGKRIQGGLCLVPDKVKVSFGSTTRAAIVLFRQTSAAAHFPPPKSTGELSAEEASFLAKNQCDGSCYRNAYEYYEFGVNTRNKQASLQNLAEKLKKAKPGLDIPPKPSELCDLRSAILLVQTTVDAFSKWKNSNGTLDLDFVNTLPPLIREHD